MERDKALIIFVRNPVKGKVKSRLAKDIGEEKALGVYLLLLQHTLKISKDAACDKFVFYTDFIPETDGWNIAGYQQYTQEGNDLGERMKNAFEIIFSQRYKKVIIIGSDCYDLETTDIEIAFKLVQDTGVIIGPARDGGYYLLGLAQNLPGLFDDIPWSTDQVLKKTIAKLKQLKIPFALLPVLNDIDIKSDLGVGITNKIELPKEKIAWDK